MGESTRRALSTALAVLSALTLLTAVLAGYASIALYDSDQFADRATAALEDEAVKSEIASRVTEDVVLAAQADLVGAKPVIEGVVESIVSGSVFQAPFRSGVRDLHRALFRHDLDTATLTLADIGTVLRGLLQTQLANEVDADVEVTIEIQPPGWFTDLAQAGDKVKLSSLVLLVAGLGLAALAIGVSRRRHRTVLELGVAVVIAGVLAAVCFEVTRSVLVGRIDEPGLRDAVDAIWGVYLDDLILALFLFAGCGSVLAAAASSLLRPDDVEGPIRRLVGLVTRIPERGWLRAIRALALIVVGIVVIVGRQQALSIAAIAAGVLIAYGGVSELMRMTMPAPGEHELRKREGRRVLVAAGVVAAAILIAGGVFIGLGGAREESLEIETVGCNGSHELCEQPLDQVAFATTHNAMSATSNDEFLFGMQEAGFADQLRDGVRGFLIDAHYGQPTEDGAIKTDLSDLDGEERKRYERELGAESLDAALRIRDRIVDSPTTGERGVYLCHRFCELGAVPIVEAFKTMRDFLAANPEEVLVVVIEDYVAPADIADAAERSGLLEYVYKGRPGPPWPTLGEMVDSGGRVLVMAESEDGGARIPWYHNAYEELVQETPFRFTEAEQLTDPANLAASCEPNRGRDDASLFLLNHWIDTSPSPRPSNAKKVNTERVLLERIRRCEKLRGLPAGLIAVDFYREGDLIDVVGKLNARRAR